MPHHPLPVGLSPPSHQAFQAQTLLLYSHPKWPAHCIPPTVVTWTPADLPHSIPASGFTLPSGRLVLFSPIADPAFSKLLCSCCALPSAVSGLAPFPGAKGQLPTAIIPGSRAWPHGPLPITLPFPGSDPSLGPAAQQLSVLTLLPLAPAESQFLLQAHAEVVLGPWSAPGDRGRGGV